MAKLGDVFNLQMGKTPARANAAYWTNGTNAWVSIADLSSYEKYVGDTKEQITDLAVQESGIKAVPADTIIMSFKLSLGKTAITKVPIYTNEAIMAFLPTGKYDVCPDYFFHRFSGRDWSEGTNRAVMGATLNKATLSNMEIVIPPLDEQRRIAAVLDKVSDLIAKRREQLDKLDELVKARFVEMFGDPETNPKGWQRQRLDEICENLDNRRVPITSTNRKAGIYPYYGASGIVDYVDDYIFDEDILLISEDGANLVMRSTPIAFSVSGKVWVNNHAHVVRFDSQATQKYIEICFSLTDISGYITGTAQPKLNQAKLNAMMFCIPPLAMQKQFANFVAQTDKSKLTIQQSLDKLEVLKKALMQQYFG